VSPDGEQLQANGPAAAATAGPEKEVSGRLLAIIRDLVWELHPHLRWTATLTGISPSIAWAEQS